jgi:hypothetical protein
MGSNLIQGLRFHDSYRPNYPDTGTSSPGANALYVLGDDITITDNVFEATYSAVEAWWHRLPESSLGKGLHGEDLIGNRNVVVTGNTFAVYEHSGAVGFAVLEDSVISRNTFLAGAYPHTVALWYPWRPPCRHQREHRQRHRPDAQLHLIGWRAGIFLNHTASQENILVAGNRFSCIGSRSGIDADHKSDGEAISTDAPGTSLGFRFGKWVTYADRNTVTIAADRHDMRLSLRHEEYTGRWIQVDFGPGLAQSRKITDARELMPGHVTFAVSPPFDVVPSLGSRIIIYQQTWQIYIVDNAIDNASSHTLTFTVHLDAQPAGDMVVTATSTAGNMAAVSPAPLVFTPSNYAMPLAVTVTQLTPQFVSAQTSMTLRRRGYANKTVAVSIDDGSQSGDGREGEVNRWLGRKF